MFVRYTSDKLQEMATLMYRGGSDYVPNAGTGLAPFKGVPTRMMMWRHVASKDGRHTVFHNFFLPKLHLYSGTRMLPWLTRGSFRRWKDYIQQTQASKKGNPFDVQYIHVVEFDRENIIRMFYVYGSSGIVGVFYDSGRMPLYYRVYRRSGEIYAGYSRPDVTTTSLEFASTYRYPELVPATEGAQAYYRLIGD